MNLLFSKMHGAGNSFIIANNTEIKYPNDKSFIQNICHPHRGIGADGFIFISKSEIADFKMDFYNCDGSKADMCGNGLRCIAKFAKTYLTEKKVILFETGAGILETKIIDETHVQIEIPLIKEIEELSLNEETIYYGNTGVPHAIIVKNDISNFDLKKNGCEIRNDKFFAPEGTNVNFIQILDNGNIKIRTYERGVEGETLACGTGITASGLTLNKFFNIKTPITFITKDDDILNVEIKNDKLFLTGEAIEIGKIELSF